MRFSRWLSGALLLVGLSFGAQAATPNQTELYRAIGPYQWVYPLADYIDEKVTAGGIYCDPSASLDACYAMLPASGGRMVLPPNRTIVLTSTLTIANPNVTIECPSWNTIIQRGPALANQVIRMDGAGSTIRGCTIDGNGGVNVTGAADLLMTGANSLVDHIQAIGAGGTMAVGLAGANSRLTGSTITGLSQTNRNNLYCVWANNHDTVKVDHNTISNCAIDGIGISGEGSIASDNHVFNAHCYSGGQGGQIVSYAPDNNVVLANNTIGQGCATTAYGYEVGGPNTTIIGGSVTNSQLSGIEVDSGAGPGLTITGITVRNSGLSGLGAGLATQGTIAGLTVSGSSFIDDQVVHTMQYGLFFQTFGNYAIASSVVISGYTTAPVGGAIPDLTWGGMKDNRIFNPCFAVDQRKEGGDYTNGALVKMIDRWEFVESANGFKVSRSSATAMSGCPTSMLVTATAGTVTPGATDNYYIFQGIEGVSVQDLNYGAANASPLVLEFQAKSSVAGTYSYSLLDGASARYYIGQFTLAANTLTPVLAVIPGDTGGVIPNTTAYGLYVAFNMGSGSTITSSTLNAWTAGNHVGATSDTKFIGAAAASTFNVSGVRLYPGTAHVPWQQLSQAETFAALQRYAAKSFPDGTAPAQNTGAALGAASGLAVTAAAGSGTWVQFPVRMRVAPTITFYSTNAATTACWDATAAAAGGASSAVNTGVAGFMAKCASGTTAADLLQVHWLAEAE